MVPLKRRLFIAPLEVYLNQKNILSQENFIRNPFRIQKLHHRNLAKTKNSSFEFQFQRRNSRLIKMSTRKIKKYYSIHIRFQLQCWSAARGCKVYHKIKRMTSYEISFDRRSYRKTPRIPDTKIRKNLKSRAQSQNYYIPLSTFEVSKISFGISQS